MTRLSRSVTPSSASPSALTCTVSAGYRAALEGLIEVRGWRFRRLVAAFRLASTHEWDADVTEVALTV